MPFTNLSAAGAKAAPSVSLGAPLTNYGLTLEAMRAEVELLIVGRSDIAEDRITGWINEAYLDLFSSVRFPERDESFELVLDAGQHLYMLPEGIENIQGASVVLPSTSSYSDGHPLESIGLDRYRRLLIRSDEPKYFVRRGNLFVVWPTPSADRTVGVDVSIVPQRLVSASDSPIISEEWHEAIKLGARRRAFSAMLEAEKAAAEQNDYIDFIRRRRDPAAEQQEGRIIRSSVPRTSKQITNRTYHSVADEDDRW